MITVIFFAVLIGVLISVTEWGYMDDLSDYFLVFIQFLLGAVFGCLFGLFVACLLPAKEQEVKYTYNLETLQDGNSVSGSFFLGCGAIDGKMQYVYYYESPDGYRMNQIDYDNVVIKYSEEDPRIETYKMEPIKGKFINLFAFDIPQERNIIYVPKGTIKQNFTLDAQ